jgi:AcrR family transcriptional regulator
MAETDNNRATRAMKIAELCRRSGFTRSTVHHYLNLGLLHSPQKAGLNLSLYDESHLAKLGQIRRMKDEGYSLSQIKELMDGQRVPRVEAEDNEESLQYLGSIGEASAAKTEAQRKREKILDTAIELFSRKGYENTKISDITDALHMGKGTFYVYFKNKEELFLECIDRLTMIIVPKEAWDAIRKEEDYILRGHKRGIAFLNAFPGFRGILNLLRIALGGDDPKLAQKARETFRILSTPMMKDIQKAKAAGVMRPDLDEEFVGYFLLVLAEGLGYWQMMDSRYTTEEGMQILSDFFSRALVRPEKAGEIGNRHAISGKVTDQKGATTALENICIEEKPILSGKMGEANVEIELAKASKISLRNDEGKWTAEAIMKDGQKVVAEVDERHTLSGNATFGNLAIPLEKIARISLGNSGP